MVFIKDEIYWIWLQQGLSQGSSKLRTVLRLYKDAKSFYEAGKKEWMLCGCFTKKELTLLETFSLEKAEEILSRCSGLGIDIVTFNNTSYPDRLKAIVNPPCVMYVKGKIPDVDQRVTIGVVGTRSSTAYGLEMSYKISNELAKLGTVIVSGGALGIDSSAHKGALSAGASTILVMGCGINYRYLIENAQLRKEVSQTGALISEYPPDTPALPRNFPMRNRIISGLSMGILVVEAGIRSGSLITANMALEQNRDLFAVPGNANSSVSMGTNKLIKECAKPVTCANDILEEYSHLLVGEKVREEDKVDKQKSKMMSKSEDDKSSEGIPAKIKESLSSNALILYDMLDSNAQHVDILSKKTNIPIKNLLQAITELELNGLIKSQSGRRYSK